MSLLVIAGQKPFDRRDYCRFGIGKLSENGIPVSIIDCSPLVGNQGSTESAYRESDVPHIMVGSLEEFAQALKGYDKNKTVAFCHFWGNSTAARLWPWVNGFTVMVATLGCIPRSEYTGIQRILRGIKKPLGVLKRYCLYRRYPYIDYWIMSGFACLEANKTHFKISKDTRFIYAHSFDYELARSRNKTIRDDQPIVVIDQNLTAHPDFKRQGVSAPATPEGLGSAMRGLIRVLRTRFDLPVVVAAHQTSSKDALAGIYGDVEIVFGCTRELIRSSKLVIGYMSTALQWAVIDGKPIFLFTTDELSAGHLQAQSRAMGKELSIVPQNIDEPDWKFCEKELGPDPEAYARFISNFIACDKSDFQQIWQYFQFIHNRSVGFVNNSR